MAKTKRNGTIRRNITRRNGAKRRKWGGGIKTECGELIKIMERTIREQFYKNQNKRPKNR